MLFQALNDGLTKREDLFVVTKIADIHHDRASESQEHQLKLLGLEYSGTNHRSVISKVSQLLRKNGLDR